MAGKPTRNFLRVGFFICSDFERAPYCLGGCFFGLCVQNPTEQSQVPNDLETEVELSSARSGYEATALCLLTLFSVWLGSQIRVVLVFSANNPRVSKQGFDGGLMAAKSDIELHRVGGTAAFEDLLAECASALHIQYAALFE